MTYGVTFDGGFLPKGEFVFYDAKTRNAGSTTLLSDRVNLGRVQEHYGLGAWANFLNGTYLSGPEPFAQAEGRLSGLWGKEGIGFHGRGTAEANVTLIRFDKDLGDHGKVKFGIGYSTAISVDGGAYAGTDGLKARGLVSGSFTLLAAKGAYEGDWRGRWGSLRIEVDARGRFISIAGAAGYEAQAGERWKFRPVAEFGPIVGGYISPQVELRANWSNIAKDWVQMHVDLAKYLRGQK